MARHERDRDKKHVSPGGGFREALRRWSRTSDPEGRQWVIPSSPDWRAELEQAVAELERLANASAQSDANYSVDEGLSGEELELLRDTDER
jgi:hypothetical protein